MRTFTIIIASIVVVAVFSSGTRGQGYTFANKNNDYVIEFPSSKWQAVPSSSLVSSRTRTEFIYGDNDVTLLVRRKLVDAKATPKDMIRRRQLWDRNLAGYVLLKEESFAGRLSGAKFAYEYTRGGKPMIALTYYLEANNRIIYGLLFRGPRDEMENLRTQADSIANSFRLKKHSARQIERTRR